MRPTLRLVSTAFAAALLAALPLGASAQGHAGAHGGGGGHWGGGGGHWGGGGGHWGGGGGHWGGGGWHGHGGWGWGGVSIGVGFAPWYYPYYPYYGYYPYSTYYPGYVVAAPAYPVTANSGDTAVSTSPASPPAAAPEPIVYPRNGQSAEQTETDRRECNRWAMSQPRAMADASVFHRATIACLEGRGYTVR